MARRAKADYSIADLKRAIELLEGEKPITKKSACEILGIAYNTTRLGKIITEYKEDIHRDKAFRKKLRGKPATKHEMGYVISAYLSQEPISKLAASTHRSPAFIKGILYRHNVPLRNAEHTYHNPVFLADGAIREDYKKNDLVYSARYGAVAFIESLAKADEEHGSIYKIFITGDSARMAYQPYYELGDLTEVQKEHGLEIYQMDGATINQLIAEGITNGRKRNKNV